MSRVAVRNLLYEEDGSGGRISAQIAWPGKEGELFYTCKRTSLVPHSEAFVAAFLVHAMALGQELLVEGAVSPQLQKALPTIQDIFTSWMPKWNRVCLVSESKEEARLESGKNAKVATFFSGGVDSFYTLLKHQQEIDVLVFVHGFDVDLDDRALRSEVSKRLQEAADAFGKKLIEVETNLRAFIDQPRLTKDFYNWELLHGAALASVAHLLPGDITKVYIPATHSYRQLYAWGSHPLLDPLWSTEERTFVHDGCEATRLQKCDLLATSDVALRALRVCWQNAGSAYNCGRCEKCQRTMLDLLAAGALDRCSSFNEPLEPQRVARRKIKKQNIRRHYTEVLERLKKTGGHDKMVKAIEKALMPPSLLRRTMEKTLKTGLGVYNRTTFAKKTR